MVYLLKLGMIWGQKLERTEGGPLPSVHRSAGISIGTRREESDRQLLQSPSDVSQLLHYILGICTCNKHNG